MEAKDLSANHGIPLKLVRGNKGGFMSIEKNLSKAVSLLTKSFHLRKLVKILPLFSSTALLAGCAHRYDITLTNGVRLTNVTKPVLHRDDGVFIYKDVTGKEHHVNAARVVDIGPHSNKNTIPGTLQQ
jgi:hypothetical protein